VNLKRPFIETNTRLFDPVINNSIEKYLMEKLHFSSHLFFSLLLLEVEK